MIRWYISPYSGTGAWNDPWHAAAWDVINPETEDCTGMNMPQKRQFIVRVRALQATHDRIIAEAKGKPISKLIQEQIEDAELETIFSDSEANENAESEGYSITWVSGNNTLRDVLRYFLRIVVFGQIVKRNALIKKIFELGLSSTVNALSPAERTAAKDWMVSRGLAIGWITNKTTIREILHFVVMNLGFGKIKVAGKEF